MRREIKASANEYKIFQEIKDISNTGNLKLALERAIQFLDDYPGSYLAKYEYAVCAGDYGSSQGLSESEKEKYKRIGKEEFKKLLEHPDFTLWPQDFQFRTRNEFYYFNDLPEEQYKLGLEKIALGLPGDYSATVGAAMMAVKALKAGDLDSSEVWAERCLDHFTKFEVFAPHWYNINFFSSKALACLGRYEDASKNFVDMYRKRSGPIVENEVFEFRSKFLCYVKDLRLKAGAKF